MTSMVMKENIKNELSTKIVDKINKITLQSNILSNYR